MRVYTYSNLTFSFRLLPIVFLSSLNFHTIEQERIMVLFHVQIVNLIKWNQSWEEKKRKKTVLNDSNLHERVLAFAANIA